MKVGEVAADPNGSALVWQIWKEAAAVSEALGVEGVWEFTVNNYDNLLGAISNYYPSMAQDMLFNDRQTTDRRHLRLRQAGRRTDAHLRCADSGGQGN